MPAFRIAVDDEVIATVDTTGMAVIDIRVTSMRTWQPRATLEVAGLPVDAPTDTRASIYFVTEYQLVAGQRVTVELLTAGATSPAGKTAAELYPDDPPYAPTDFSPAPAAQADLAARPVFHDSFEFSFTASTGTTAAAHTPAGHEGVSFNILWPYLDENEAHMSVRSHGPFLSAEHPGAVYVREKLHVGGSLTYTVG